VSIFFVAEFLMNRQIKKYIISIILIFLTDNCFSETGYEECLLKAIANSTPTDSVKNLQDKCLSAKKETKKNETILVEIPAEDNTSVEKRHAVETIAEELPFLLAPHKSNYILPVTYNSSINEKPFEDENLNLDKAEVKFQFSVKSRIVKGLFDGVGDLWFGYTNLSFWQAYNTSNSSSFRETNHEPEFFMDFHPNIDFGGWKTNLIRIGGSHQSNGNSNSRSRSWNRIYAMVTAEQDNWFFSVKPWYRIPESKKDSPNDTHGDDNPDIYKYAGYGDLLAYYKLDENTIGLTFRNNLSSNNKSGIQLDWTFPLKDKLRGYVQYYNGYDESLIDYNASVNRIGIGVMFSDIL